MTRQQLLLASVLSLSVLTGCHHVIAPKLTYALPPTAMLPIESIGIRDASNTFGASFCSVFQEFQSQEQHGCYHYFRDSQPKEFAPAPLLASDAELRGYRYVIVNGFMSGCFPDSTFQVFGDADRHLSTHGISLERVPLHGMETPEADAEQIIDYLESPNSLADVRPIIVVGYSKGATDLQATLLRLQQTSTILYRRVRALVTVAGMIGGTRLYDQVDHPEDLADLLSHFEFFSCPAGQRDFRSLSRQQRQNFLKLHWRELIGVPTYSLTTVSTSAETSHILQPLWQQLSVYGVDQDSQMAQTEQIPPGAVYLGIARADHWAIALPLENDSRFQWLADKNHYPRTAMLEAIFRFVVADLGHHAAEANMKTPFEPATVLRPEKRKIGEDVIMTSK